MRWGKAESLTFNAIVQSSMDTYKLHDRNIHPNNFWHTWHTAVYDLAKRTLRVNIQENYAKHYDFKLNLGGGCCCCSPFCCRCSPYFYVYL